MSDDDKLAGSSDPGAFPPNGIPMMAPPPMSGGFGAVGLPPPNPGRASGGTKLRTRRGRHQATEAAEGDAPPRSSREPPAPAAGMSVFTPFVPSTAGPEPSADPQPDSPAAEPEANLMSTTEDPAPVPDHTQAQQAKEIDSSSQPISDSYVGVGNDWDPEGGSFEAPPPTATSSDWDPEGGDPSSVQQEPIFSLEDSPAPNTEASIEATVSVQPDENSGWDDDFRVENTSASDIEVIEAAETFPEVELPPPATKKKEQKKTKGKKKKNRRASASQGISIDAFVPETVPDETQNVQYVEPTEIPASEAAEILTQGNKPESPVVEDAVDALAVDGWGDTGDDFGFATEQTTEFVEEYDAPADSAPVVETVDESVVHAEDAGYESFPVESSEEVTVSDEAPKTRKKKKRVGEGTVVPDQPQFSTDVATGEPSKRKKKGKKASAKHPAPADSETPPEHNETSTDTGAVEPGNDAAVDAQDSNVNFDNEGVVQEPETWVEESVYNAELEAAPATESNEVDAPDDSERPTKALKKPKKKKLGKKSAAKLEQLQQELAALTAENAAMKAALANPETRAELITQEVLSELERLRQLSTEQQEKIEALLAQIDELHLSRSNTSSSGSESDAADRISALELQNTDLKVMYESAERLRDEISADRQRLQDHVSQLSTDLDRLRKEQEESKQQNTTLQEQCRALVEKWNSYREVLDSEKKSASEELDAAQRERDRVAAERSALDEERKRLRIDQEALEAEKAVFRGTFAREKELFEQSRQQLDRELEALQVQLETFEREKSNDPQLRTLLAGDFPSTEASSLEPSEADAELRSELEELRQKLSSAERLIEDLQGSSSQVDELNATISRLVEQHKKIEDSRLAELKDLQNRYDTKLSENKNLEGEVEDLCQRIDLIEKDNAELREDIQNDRRRAGENLKHWNEKTSLLQQELDALAESNKALLRQKEELQRQLEDTRSQIHESPKSASTDPNRNANSGWDDFDDDFGTEAAKPKETEPAPTNNTEELGYLREENASLQGELRGMYELVQKYEREIEEMSEKLLLRSDDTAELNVQLDTLRSKLAEASLQSNEVVELHEQIATLRSAQEEAAKGVAELQSQVDELAREKAAAIKETANVQTKLRAELEQLREQTQHHNNEKAQLAGALDDLQTENQRLNRQLVDMENIQRDFISKLEVAEREIESQLDTISQLRDQLSDLSHKSTPAPAATQDEGWDAGFGDDFGAPAASGAEDFASIQAQLLDTQTRLEEAVLDLEKARNSNADYEERLRMLETKVIDADAQNENLVAELRETVADLRSQLDVKSRDIEKIELAAEEQVARYEAEIVELKALLESAEGSARDTSSSERILELEGVISSLRTELDGLRAIEPEVSELRGQLRSLAADAESKQAEMANEISSLRRQLAEFDNYSELQLQLEDLRAKFSAKVEQLKENIAVTEDYMAQIGQLTKQTKHLSLELQAKSATIDGLEASLQERERDMDALNDDLEASNKRLQEVQADLQSRSEMLSELEERTAQRIDELEAALERERSETAQLHKTLAEVQSSGSVDRTVIEAQLSEEWTAKVAQIDEQHSQEVQSLREELEEVRTAALQEVEQAMNQVHQLQETNARLSSELETRDSEITQKTATVRDIQERMRSLEERYKEQVIAADQFMGETSNYRKQIKKLTDTNEKLTQENASLSNQLTAIQADFEAARSRILALDERLKERTGASDAQVAELSAIAARLKAELLALQQQRENEILAKDQEIERIRIEKQEEFERMSMQIDDLFREREEVNIRLESSSAEVSRATTRFMTCQRELETLRSELQSTIRTLQTEKDALEDAAHSSHLRALALESESKSLESELQTQVADLNTKLTAAVEEREALEKSLRALEQSASESRVHFERTNSDHVQTILALQQQVEKLNEGLAEETSRNTATISNLMQRLEQLQTHANLANPSSVTDALQHQLSDKDALIQSLLQEKDELVQRLVVSTQDASSPVDKIVAAKEELEVQLFRMQESLRLAAAENAALRERLQVETQRDQVTKLNTAIEILKREKDELSKQLNAIRSGSAETETVQALRAEKQQLTQLLFSKTIELEDVLQERAALQRRLAPPATPTERPAAAEPTPQAGKLISPPDSSSPPVTETNQPNLNSASTDGKSSDPNQSGWVSGVWNVIWGTD